MRANDRTIRDCKLRIENGDFSAYEDMAEYYYWNGEIENGDACYLTLFDQDLDADPETVAWALLRSGRFEEGLKLAREFELDPYLHGSLLAGVGEEDTACEYYLRAAEFGDGLAMVRLGIFAEGADEDDRSAEYWYRKALALGETSARELLAKLLERTGSPNEADKVRGLR